MAELSLATSMHEVKARMEEILVAARPPRPPVPPPQERPTPPPLPEFGGLVEDRVELSPGLEDYVTDPLAMDALLFKTVFEGKDWQTAKREVEAERAALREGGQPRNAPPPAQGGSETFLSMEVTTLQASHVELEVQTAEGHVRMEATRVEVQQVRLTASAGTQARKKDPLLFDLTGEGPATTGAQGARAFDLEGNGDVSPTSFATGGSAFLALDRNGNGRIDSGLELFGDQYGARDGYEELAKFDADQNGVIDAQDPVYGRLQLLTGDGSTQGLADQDIVSISLAARAKASTTTAGDDILRSATAFRSDGRALATYAMALQRF